MVANPGRGQLKKENELYRVVVGHLTHIILIYTLPYHMNMYVCMYGHTYSKSMDQPGKVASPARGQLKRKNEYFRVRVRA